MRIIQYQPVFMLYYNSMNRQRNKEEQSKANKAANRLTTVLFVVSLIVLYWILLLKLGVQFSYMENRSVNLIPFSGPPILNVENILNTVIFIPLGIYAGILFQRWMFGKQLLFSLLFSLLVEGLQYILRLGAFDVTDICTNTFGGIIGFMIFKVIETAFNDHMKTQKFINIMAAAGTVLIISLFVLLKMNMLPIRYQ